MESNNKGLSRRNFIQMIGVGAASAMAAGALSGCAPHGKKETEAKDGDYSGTYDVIVVGAGIAGVSAAITVAREGNGASCLLIEKESEAAGCSPVCNGDFLGRDDDNPYPVQYLKDMAQTSIGPSVPDDVLEAFAEGIDENLQWVLDLGATMDMLDTKRQVYEDRSKSEYREFDSWASAEYSFDDNAGYPYNHVFNFLTYTMNTQYPEIVYKPNTPLQSLIQNDDGRVVGVVAGDERYSARKGVIMCCGGYEHSPEFLEGFCGVGNAISFAMKGNTGDGHKAAARVGADFWHMHNAAGFWMAGRNLENTQFSNNALTSHKFKKYGITVAKNGRRFYMDWDGHKSIDAADDALTEGMTQEEKLALHVGSRHGVMQFGGEWTHLPMPSIAWFIFDSDNLSNAIDYKTIGTQDPVADGWLYQADTIEELAEKCGVPASELTATVDQWNEFCDKGRDMAFYRPADTLTPIRTAPFYAQRCNPAMLNTDGGPVRNAKGQIVGVDGEPIEGLYSAGEFGSVWGYLYQGDGNVGEAMAFGRISARSALSA